MTAVSRVDFLLQTPMVKGEMNKATAVESAPSQPAERFMTKIILKSLTKSIYVCRKPCHLRKVRGVLTITRHQTKAIESVLIRGCSLCLARGTVKLLFLNSFNYISWMFELRKEFLFILEPSETI